MRQKPSFSAEIILDARMIRHSGIGTYLQGLLDEYEHHPFFDQHSLAVALPDSVSPQEEGGIRSLFFSSPIYSLWEQMEYPFRLNQCRLWHSPHYNIPLMKKKTRLVVTIHDLIHWIFRKEFYSPFQEAYCKFFFKKVVEKADRIIAVSHQTRDDLIQYFNASPDRIRVIYEGVSRNFLEAVDPGEKKGFLEKYKLPARFFLYVGLIKPHKNVRRLLEVFQALRKEHRMDSALVLVGRKDPRYPKGSETLRELDTRDGIHYLPQVESRKELSYLYASAQALVHPSFYEGFGLTCLEAMASGTPVIVSRVASLPEVVGEAGYYVDPYSEESLRQAILELEENDSLRRELAEKGKLRARQFSWTKAARETTEVYKEVLEQD